MRIIYLLLLASAGLMAQPSLTTVSDTLYNTDGTRFTGNLQIQSQSFSSTGAAILQQIKNINLKPTNGVLTVALVPNDSSSPSGTSYVFTYSSGTKMTCVIPTSSLPITLSAHCTFASPTPVLSSVLPIQIVGAGATCVTCCLARDSSSGLITGLVACSGGGVTGKTWSQMTGAWSQQIGSWSAQ